MFSENLNYSPDGRTTLPLDQGLLVDSKPPRVVIDFQNGTRIDFKHLRRKGDREESPVHLYVDFAAQEVHDPGLLKIHLIAPQFLPMSAVACCRQRATLSDAAAERQLLDKPMQPVTMVLQTPFGQRFEYITRMLLSHASYHMCLGVVRYAMYMTEDLYAHFVHEPFTRGLISRGLLRPMALEVPLYEGLPYAWHALAYSHAQLVYWGTGHRLFFVDLDEYLALPGPNARLGAMLQQYANSSNIRIERVDAMSSHKQDQTALWRAGKTTQALRLLDRWGTALKSPRRAYKGLVDTGGVFNLQEDGTEYIRRSYATGPSVTVPTYEALLIHIPAIWTRPGHKVPAAKRAHARPVEDDVWLSDSCMGRTANKALYEQIVGPLPK